MDGWSVTQLMNIYKRRLLMESLNGKSKMVMSMQVSALLSKIAYHLPLFWLQTVAVIYSES